WMLADSAVEIHASRLMAYHLAWLVDQGEQPIKESSIVKLHNTEMVNRVADRAVQIFGGAGYMSEYGIERFYRDVRLFRLYEGTTQIQQVIIARNMVREARAA
ncbi:MAG TPA: acyl-CoA dehydrogenase family protein, partial [Candidatus Dormibacteraeota bacterium]|nr:acyl-CoA dehydrogenase family protein [Candidatus Dormibacteraeota bacterium]